MITENGWTRMFYCMIRAAVADAISHSQDDGSISFDCLIQRHIIRRCAQTARAHTKIARRLCRPGSSLLPSRWRAQKVFKQGALSGPEIHLRFVIGNGNNGRPVNEEPVLYVI